jgi:hypothetical protein
MTPEKIVRRYYQLINERRLDDAAALVDGHAVFHYVPTRQRFVGRDGFRKLMAFWLSAFEDAQLQLLSVLPLNDHAVQIEFLGKGTHTGDLALGEAGTLPATGRTAELPFRNLLEIHNGIITGVELDFDVQELKRRLAAS